MVDLDHLIQIQSSLSEKVKIEPIAREPSFIAGFDMQMCDSEIAIGVLSVFDSKRYEIVEEVIVRDTVTMPYITGFLAFREFPIFQKSWHRLKNKPDVVAFDGHGIMHPRRMGLASHAGVELGVSSFGIAKQPLIGKFVEPEHQMGSWTEIIHKNEVVGACLRTKDDTKPLYVSAGHLITLEKAIQITLAFSKFRIPELTRIPDITAREQCRHNT